MEQRVSLHIIPVYIIVSWVNEKNLFPFITVLIIMLKICNQHGFASQKFKKINQSASFLLINRMRFGGLKKSNMELLGPYFPQNLNDQQAFQINLQNFENDCVYFLFSYHHMELGRVAIY